MTIRALENARTRLDSDVFGGENIRNLHRPEALNFFGSARFHQQLHLMSNLQRRPIILCAETESRSLERMKKQYGRRP